MQSKEKESWEIELLHVLLDFCEEKITVKDVRTFIGNLVATARIEERAAMALEAIEILHKLCLHTNTTQELDLLETAQRKILSLGVTPQPPSEEV